MLEDQYQQSTPPTTQRRVLSVSSSMSPPTTPNRQRAVGWWQASVVRRSSSAVDEAVDELTEKSRFLLRTTPRRTSSTRQPLDSPLETDDTDEEQANVTNTPTIATFDREEILTGQLLGEGTFSSVYEVVGFALHHNTDDNHKDDSNPLRTSIAHSDNPTRFALKHLKPSLLENTLQFEQAATDLVMEAKYMAALNHPNILKLHGEPRNGTAAINSGVDGYFLLTDRLSETLAQRIQRWSQGQDTDTNTVPCKLNYALQIAQALSYLHQQRIIFRDLKPSNIGFHQQDPNRIQLFDFGLCRELPPRKAAREYKYGEEIQTTTAYNSSMDLSEYSEDLVLTMDESWNDDTDDTEREEVYYMSGAGTQIYMAPEVLTQNRYNLKADVYSWAMTVTELLLLEKPLPLYDLDEHIQYICVEGDRPSLEGHDEITPNVRDLLAWAWEADVAKRCSMAQVCEELSEVIAEAAADAMTVTTKTWPSKIWQAVRRIPRYLVSLLGRALERVSDYFFFFWRTDTSTTTTTTTTQGSSTNSSRDVTFQEQREPPPSPSHPPPETSHHRVFLSPRPAPPRFSSSRSAILKRKPSSASTTAMTDDELDDDYYYNNYNGYELGAAAGVAAGAPLSPACNYYSKPPPMEALVERHNSAVSTGTA